MMKKAYIFFNCDEDKSLKSMNITYNTKVFKDTKTSRKMLWKYILTQQESGAIDIYNLEKAEKAVTEGDPCKASEYMKYGNIVQMDLL